MSANGDIVSKYLPPIILGMVADYYATIPTNPKLPAIPWRCPICNGTGVMPPEIRNARRAAGVSPDIMPEVHCAGCNGTGVVR